MKKTKHEHFWSSENNLPQKEIDSKIQIEDDFLPQKEFDKIHKMMIDGTPSFPWYYTNHIDLESDVDKFQFIHLDVDLYQPTKDSLDFFYPKLAQGGIIVCDDYNFSTFPGAKKAWDEFFNDKRNGFNFFYEIPFGGCLIIK